VASNTVPLRAPHSPKRFARIQVMPADASVRGFDRSDTLFTIQALVSLPAVPAPDRAGATVITWSTAPGPAEVALYDVLGWLVRTIARGSATDDHSARLLGRRRRPRRARRNG
jgi:hypothetical protein